MQVKVVDLSHTLPLFQRTACDALHRYITYAHENDSEIFVIKDDNRDYKARVCDYFSKSKDTFKIEIPQGDDELATIRKAAISIMINECGTHTTVNEHSVSVHVFVAPKLGHTFPLHTDPIDLLIYCIQGEKSLQVGDEIFTLTEGSGILIPKDTPHMAINHEESIIFSIGYGATLC